MNINCQNSAYVGRTNLSQDDTIHKLLQGEIDILTSNLDTTNSNLQTLQTNYDITSNGIYEDLNPLTWLINTEITPATILPPFPDKNSTYIYNSNVIGDIRFWVKDTSNYPVVIPIGVPDYRVKIDYDGKLKLYYTYDPLINLTYANGWVDIVNGHISLVADSANQGIALGVLQTEVGLIDAKYNEITGQILFRISTGDLYTNFDDDEEAQMNFIMGATNIRTGTNPQFVSQSVGGLFNDVSGFLATGRTAFLTRATNAINRYVGANPATSFVLGVGGAAIGIAYGIAQNASFNETLNNYIPELINENSNLTSNERRILIDSNRDTYFTSNVIKNLENNYYLNQGQGFINSNIITTQTIPQFYGNKIGLGILPETSIFELDVVGGINADSYYRSDVLQFMGTETQHSNLTRSQGFINSNVLSRQTIPSISTNDIGVGNSSRIGIYTDRIENLIDSVQTNGIFIKDTLTYTPYLGFISGTAYGNSIYEDYMIKKNVNKLIFSTKKNTTLNTDLLTILGNGNVGIGLTNPAYKLDVVGDINANNYYRSNVKQFIGTETQNCNLTMSQGFINSNVLTQQTIPIIYGTKIGLGILPSTYEFDVVGKINADYYYRSGVQQFLGTETQHSNLTRSQGFINSNILTTQTIPQFYGNKIGLGILPETSTFELDVVGKINADSYYRSDVEQFMGTEIQNCNLSLSQGFINSNVLSTQNIPQFYGNKIGLGILPETSIFELDVVGKINADSYYRSDVLQFMGTETQNCNLTMSQGFINSNVLSTQFVKDIKHNILVVEGASALYSGGGRLEFNSTTGLKAKIGVNSASDQHITGSSTGDIVFRTMDVANKMHFSSTTRPQMTLATSNKIGIQTTTPRYNFDICNDPLLTSTNIFSCNDTVFRVQRQGITTVRGNITSPVIATFSRSGAPDYISICQDGIMSAGCNVNYDFNLQAKGTGNLYLRTNDADKITIAPTSTTIANKLFANENIELTSTASTEISFSGYGVSLLGLNGGANSYAANTDAGDMVLRANTSKKIHLVSGLANSSLTIAGANVGIGRTDPQVLLHANGIIRARTGNQAYVEMCSSDSAQTGYLNFTNSSGSIKAMFGFETGDYLNLNTYGTCLGLANSGELVSTGTITANGGIDAYYVSTNNTVSCGLLVATNITTSAPQIFKRFAYFLNMTSMGGSPTQYYANIDISNIEMIQGNPTSISIRVLEVIIYGQNGGIAIGEVCFIGYVFLRSNAFYYFTQTVLSDSCNFVPTSFQNLYFSTTNSQPCICVIRAFHY